MRVLYHFPTSPFARRARLALAHKGLDAELRDARTNEAFLAEARSLVPLKTIPVLVDGDRALADSNAIVHYLDRTYAEGPALWPSGDDAFAAFETAALVDVALSTLVDVGTRFWPLREHAAWERVKEEHVGRAQKALDALGERVGKLGRATVAKSGWAAADMWIFTATAWLEGLPARAAQSPNVAQIVSLGWTLPAALPRWAEAHRGRADVVALG
jgi:glutathione S-transferase